MDEESKRKCNEPVVACRISKHHDQKTYLQQINVRTSHTSKQARSQIFHTRNLVCRTPASGTFGHKYERNERYQAALYNEYATRYLHPRVRKSFHRSWLSRVHVSGTKYIYTTRHIYGEMIIYVYIWSIDHYHN